MSALLSSLAPLGLFVALGILLRRVRFATVEQGAFLLKLVVFVTLPALIAASMAKADLSWAKLQLPLIAVAVDLGCLLSAWLWLRRRALADAARGAALVSVMIMNNLLMFPVILARYGEAAFADAVLFDLGNATVVATLGYMTACRYGGLATTPARVAGKLAASPLFWSIVAGGLINCGAIPLPMVLRQCLVSMGGLTGPLTLIALGITIRPYRGQTALLLPTVLFRMGIGTALGAVFALLCQVQGIPLLVILLCSGAPVGFVSVSLASVAGLDASLAASAISASAATAALLVPLWLVLAEVLLGV
jgi:predicted permease